MSKPQSPTINPGVTRCISRVLRDIDTAARLAGQTDDPRAQTLRDYADKLLELQPAHSEAAE
jgi:hypothetical protein